MSDARPEGDVTQLLGELRQGDAGAETRLALIVYQELHRMAARMMRRERPDHTLQPTALVNEAYLRLIETASRDWRDRAHFFAVAATVMRRILVDYARTRRADKRGGERRRISLDEAPVCGVGDFEQIALIDRALTKLAAWDARQSRVVELRFFVGLSEEEIAEVLRVSTRTVKRDWRMARAWLHAELASDEVPAE